MKKILKNTLAAILLAGIAIHVTAAAQSKYEILRKQVATEVMQEMQASGTSPNEAEISQRVIAKLRIRQNEYSDAMKEDCIRDYGKANQKQCQCFINKVDYNAHLARMEKALNADPKMRAAEVEKAQQLRQEQEMTAIKACDLSIAHSQETPKVSSKTDLLTKTIIGELLQQAKSAAASGKPLTETQIPQMLADKLHTHLADFKQASKEDCLSTFGSDKKSECQCFADKLDYEAQFSLVIKTLEGEPQAQKKARQARQQAIMTTGKACGLSASIAKAKKQK